MDKFYDVENYVEIYSDTNTDFAIKRKECLVGYIKKNDIKVANVLDIACGTGVFLNLLQSDINITRCVGLDFSEKMIEYAKKKYKNNHIEYVNGDMTDFNLNERFDLITCNYDAINHLQSLDDWIKMFKNTYKHLNNNGIFIFDFNTTFKQKNFNGTSYKSFENYNSVSEVNNKDGKMNFKKIIYNKMQNGLYKMFIVELSETTFPVNIIKKALKQIGFKKIKFCNANFEKCNIKKSKRLFVICKK